MKHSNQLTYSNNNPTYSPQIYNSNHQSNRNILPCKSNPSNNNLISWHYHSINNPHYNSNHNSNTLTKNNLYNNNYLNPSQHCNRPSNHPYISNQILCSNISNQLTCNSNPSNNNSTNKLPIWYSNQFNHLCNHHTYKHRPNHQYISNQILCSNNSN